MPSFHLFFDLDRTLWDFDRNSLETLKSLYADYRLADLLDSFEAFNAVYQEENRKCWAAYQQGTMTKAILRGARFQRTLDALGIVQAGLATELGQEYVNRGPHQRHLMDGALEVLASLKERGHRLHILTNGFKEVQHIKVANTGIGEHVEAVWTSDELGHLKPALACYEGALLGSGARPEAAWMIGDDHEADVVGAHRAGWKAIHYAPAGGTPEGSPAQASIATLGELLAILP